MQMNELNIIEKAQGEQILPSKVHCTYILIMELFIYTLLVLIFLLVGRY